jgi:hypothetical protein
MNPLDNNSILSLSRILKQGTHDVPLYAVEYEHTVVATNNAWLMEWPKELVDMECPRLSKLLANHKHKDVVKSYTNLLDKHWTDVLFHTAGRYAGVEEHEPSVEGYEEDKDTILIRYRKEIIPYNWVNFEAAELFAPDADYRMYVPPKEQNMAKIMKLLVIYDDTEGRVGVFTNNFHG